MTHVHADVHPDAAFEVGEELADGAAGERHTREERVGGHALDAAQHREEPRQVLGPARREREAAVARDDRRDAVPRRR